MDVFQVPSGLAVTVVLDVFVGEEVSRAVIVMDTPGDAVPTKNAVLPPCIVAEVIVTLP
jgi:hypothetical protein